MRIRTRRLIGALLILSGFFLITFFNQVMQLYTLINFGALLLFMIGFLLIFKEIFFRFDKVDKFSVGEDPIKWLKGFGSTIITYGIAVVLILVLVELAHNANHLIGEKLIDLNTVEKQAKFLGVTKELMAFASKGVHTEFYIFEFTTDEKSIINGLNLKNDQKLKSQMIKFQENSLNVVTLRDSITIEYSAIFPTFFRIK